MKDPYEILGVPRSAEAGEIKKAYRRLARQYHPDVNKGDKGAEEKFKEVSQAYDVLGDAEKRKKYDQFGQWAQGGGFDPSQMHRSYTWTGGRGPGGVDFDLGDMFGDIFGMGGGKRRRGAGGGRAPWMDEETEVSQQGRDIHSAIEIEFMEAARGTTSAIAIDRNGRSEKLNVKIPTGVRSGTKIRLAGKGEEGPAGPGDLILRVDVKSHPDFWREDDDLYVEVPIGLTAAALGTEAHVPTLEGKISLKIPPGTSSGQKFRIKEKGFKRKVGGHGDQYAVVKIEAPKNLSAKAKALLKELAEELD